MSYNVLAISNQYFTYKSLFSFRERSLSYRNNESRKNSCEARAHSHVT